MQLSGNLDTEWYGLGLEPSGMVREDKHFVNWRIQLFAEVFLGEHLDGLVEFRADRGHAPADVALFPRINQGFLRWRVPGLGEHLALSAQAGVFATPFGNFIKRHDSWDNPLVRRPLPYDHRTTLMADFMDQFAFDNFPGTRMAFVRVWRDRPESLFPGEPLVWQEVYAGGAMVNAVLGDADRPDRFTLDVAVMNSMLGSTAYTWAEWPRRSAAWTLHSRLGWRPTFGTRVGTSFATGTWLSPDTERVLAPREYTDFRQWAVGLDFEYTRGQFDGYAEVVYTEWHAPVGTPATGFEGIDVSSLAAYVEGKYTLAFVDPGLFVAARVGFIWNDKLHVRSPWGWNWNWKWDRDQWRFELGFGYFLGPELLVKLAVEHNRTLTHDDPEDDAILGQLVLRF